MQTPRRFNFDRTLWRRFITIAQPYWYPAERGAGPFFALLGILLILVVAVAFFLASGLTLVGEAVFPRFFSEVASGLVGGIKALLNSGLPWLALVGLLGATLVFVQQRRSMAQRWRQWGILGALLLLSFSVNAANVTLSYAFRFIDNSLADRDETLFWQFLGVYFIVIVVAIPIIIVYRYTRLKLGLFWRDWLTQKFLDRYFADRSYYDLDSNAANTEIDNPDQRISEDIRSFTAVTLSFLLDILDSVLTLISFTAILYSISKALTVGLLIYALVGTGIAVGVGRRLIGLTFQQLRLEANFRYGLVHVRDNAESIAFYRGEGLEQDQLQGRFAGVINNFNLIIIWRALIDLFQYLYNYLTRFPPYLVVAPLYFAGEKDFGSIAQASLAFGQVLSALSLITNQIREISEFSAGVHRLGEFEEVLKDSQAQAEAADPSHRIATRAGDSIALNTVTLLTPNSEQTLVRELSFALESGQNMMIVGVSGAGKSSILRAIAGLWNNGKGVITRPSLDQMLFLPQRPYMLLGSLRDQIIYPQTRTDIPDQQLQQVMEQVNLPTVIERMGGLDQVKDWPNVLSLGEQQRLVFARVLLTRPQFVILDEATSALDIANEQRLYQLLQEMETTYISVGHRMTLLQYHQFVLALTGETRWQVVSAAEFADQQDTVA